MMDRHRRRHMNDAAVVDGLTMCHDGQTVGMAVAVLADVDYLVMMVATDYYDYLDS